jgi:hypothetical protein
MFINMNHDFFKNIRINLSARHLIAAPETQCSIDDF